MKNKPFFAHAIFYSVFIDLLKIAVQLAEKPLRDKVERVYFVKDRFAQHRNKNSFISMLKRKSQGFIFGHSSKVNFFSISYWKIIT